MFGCDGTTIVMVVGEAWVFIEFEILFNYWLFNSLSSYFGRQMIIKKAFLKFSLPIFKSKITYKTCTK